MQSSVVKRLLLVVLGNALKSILELQILAISSGC